MHPRQQLGDAIQPKRSFGQNFLVDDSHLNKIAALCLQRAKDARQTLIEMGGGTGALTAVLAERGGRVIVVERDRDLVPVLRERFAATPSVEIHEGNALTFPLDALRGDGEGRGGALVGNLPYHHAAEIALRARDAWPHLGGACFLVQLEVAQRMASKPGGKEYGSLSVSLQSRFDVRLAHVVPKGAFWPVPDVDGGVVVLDPLPAPRGAVHSLAGLEAVVRPAFQQRRKTVRNALRAVCTDEELAAAGIDPTQRAEQIPVDAWGRLAAVVERRATTPTPSDAS